MIMMMALAEKIYESTVLSYGLFGKQVLRAKKPINKKYIMPIFNKELLDSMKKLNKL